MPASRLVSFLVFSGLFGEVCLICGHARRPPIGGSASSNVMPDVVFPSTTALAALFDVALYSTSVCDLTFPMCVFSCLEYHSFRIWFVSWRKSLCRCWLYAAGSTVYFRIVSMQNELSARMLKVFLGVFLFECHHDGR